MIHIVLQVFGLQITNAVSVFGDDFLDRDIMGKNMVHANKINMS